MLAEPVHGSAPDIAGKGIANPVATDLGGRQLLEALGETGCAGDTAIRGAQDARRWRAGSGPGRQCRHRRSYQCSHCTADVWDVGTRSAAVSLAIVAIDVPPDLMPLIDVYNCKEKR